MGKDKALLAWPPAAPGISATGQTFLSAAIEALNPFNDLVIVVAGKNTPNLAPIVYAQGAFLVTNPTPEAGQFSSMQVGLQEVLNHGRDAAMITLVDRPPVNPDTLDRLRAAFESAVTAGKWALVPEYTGKHGHPILVAREMIEAFLKAPATATARDIEHQNQARVEYLAVDDPFITRNVDTPEDYAALTSVSASVK